MVAKRLVNAGGPKDQEASEEPPTTRVGVMAELPRVPPTLHPAPSHLGPHGLFLDLDILETGFGPEAQPNETFSGHPQSVPDIRHIAHAHRAM